MRNAIKILLAPALAFGATQAQSAELIVNGGFETPDVPPPPGGPGYQTYSTSFTGWTVTAGDVDIVDHYGGGNAGEGQQWLDLWGNQSGAISQTFSTVAGQLYNLSFLYGNNPYSTSTASGSYSVAGITGTVTSSTGLNFTLFSTTFLATSASSTLSFVNTVGGGGGGLALDAVSVSAAPEPAAWALMILGFGIAGAALRRRPALRRARAL